MNGDYLCRSLGNGASVDSKRRIEHFLDDDFKHSQNAPKEYERNRNDDDEIQFGKDILEVKTDEHILSRPFKRRLKKGYLPYWNRPLDVWVWTRYYDQLLDCFNDSFDSFGNTSLMLMARFAYLQRHFPENLILYEGNTKITLIELIRAKIISRKDIDGLNSFEDAALARLDIIKKVEKKLNIFIYEADLEVLAKNPRAFESFLLSLSGQCLYLGHTVSLPDWASPLETRFVVPNFSAAENV